MSQEHDPGEFHRAHGSVDETRTRPVVSVPSIDPIEGYLGRKRFFTLNRILADLQASRSLAGTLQAVVEGAVTLDYGSALVNLVRPDGDLVVAAVWQHPSTAIKGLDALLGQVGSRDAWNSLFTCGDVWEALIFVPYWRDRTGIPVVQKPDGGTDTASAPGDWHSDDLLLAPMYSLGGELLGVLSLDGPCDGRIPDQNALEILQCFAQQAAIAIGNARLRAEMQRALVRSEKEQHSLRASEQSFRSAFERSPTGMAISEWDSAEEGKLSQVNDSLLRILGRPESMVRKLRLPL